MKGKQRWLLLALGLLIGLVFLWFALKDLDPEGVWDALRQANYWWILPGVVVYFISVWFRAWRWGFLLRGSKKVSTNRLFPVIVIGYMGNDLLPFRLGEALRAYVLWRKEGINVGTALTTALLERMFDGLTMLLFVFVGLLLVPTAIIPSSWIVGASAAFFTALVVFLFLAARPDLMRRLARAVIERLIPTRFRAPLSSFAEGIIAGLESLRSGRDVLVLFGVTVWVWLLETLKYWLISFVFDLHLSYAAILLMGGAVNLATAIPSPPGYIGVFELGINLLVGIGVPPDLAGSYILVLHAILLIPVSLLGLFYMGLEGIRWAEVGEAARMREEAR